LKEYGIRPDELRKMAASDVFMIQACEVVSYINEEANKDKPEGEAGDRKGEEMANRFLRHE
jgi:hypothetical protein